MINNYCIARPNWLDFVCSHNPCGNCSAGLVLVGGIADVSGYSCTNSFVLWHMCDWSNFDVENGLNLRFKDCKSPGLPGFFLY